ncbi:NADP-dependent 3-hydroxy acid dehydrogenase YdfG [Hoeflea marina]|uniref:NADP-dependent 3-hydroxy acid dehydrogenase YdfG n=1 Tax=Hoeflea marina TaxID=274592 RepID=A0A317PP97_9HYPH|nr:SDR family NAD(P)-dependent oxidoreductase [Hoeflea marina]PWW00331.1 NADP-dependent 3-hydroxy acid dehydrogenase YdfG [Hoeflea marina]
MSKPVALIVGVGDGLSASLARRLHREGFDLVLAARDIDKIAGLGAETEAQLAVCDASRPADVDALFAALPGPLRLAVYNPSARQRGALIELEPEAVRHALEVTAYGAFLVGQAATRVMLAQAPEDGVRGTILFTGASAGVKGFPMSAPFAMGKFAQRGLAQSMARELHPQGIHVAWINIDGGIRNPGRTEPADRPDSMLDPDAIAESYLMLVRQQRSAWSEELSLRPWVEKF